MPDVLRMDPTRTTSISYKIERIFSKNYRELATAFKQFRLEVNVYFLTPEQTLAAFVVWLEETFNDILNQTAFEYEDLITEAYVKGAKRSYQLAKPKSIVPSAAFAAGAAAEFIRSLTTSPESKGNLGLIKENARTQYAMVNTQLKQRLSSIISVEALSGLKPKPTASKIAEAIENTLKTRAKLVARTETTRAHAEGQLDAFTALGLKNVGVRAEWSAAADACPKCAPFDGQIFTVAEAHGLIPLHPNCRCLWLPVEDSPK